MKWWRLVFLLLFLLLAGSCVATRMASPSLSGSPNAPLAPCPASPNCVCSEDPDPARRVEPLAFTGPATNAMARLRTVIRAQPRTRIVSDHGDSLQVEFRTRFLRFVDDVEFRIPPGAQVIQVRSASRVGYSDLGVNRRRVEQIREAFGQTSALNPP
jgi:uncharacterized protein (DUF1499 family)